MNRIPAAIILALILSTAPKASAEAMRTCDQLFIVTRAAVGHPVAYKESVAETEARRRFVTEFNQPGANEKYPKMKAELAEEFHTVRFVHEAGRVLPGARARVLLLHGQGASVSRGLTMTLIQRSLVEQLPSSSSTIKALRRDPNDVPLAAEAIDLPGCGVGPALSNFADHVKTVDWLGSYVREMKRATPELPVILFTRSSSAVIAVELAKKYPDLVNGLILMSPTLPGDAELVDAGREVVIRESAAKLFELNLPSLDWIDNILKAVHWSPETFQKPTYILTGSADVEMADQERAAYVAYAKANPLVAYTDYAGAEHNVLDTGKETKNAAMAAYRDVFKFIHSLLKPR